MSDSILGSVACSCCGEVFDRFRPGGDVCEECEQDNYTAAMDNAIDAEAEDRYRAACDAAAIASDNAIAYAVENGPNDPECWVCGAHCGRDLSDTSDPKMSYHFCSADCKAEFRCHDAELLG
jgi:hypothetical protein